MYTPFNVFNGAFLTDLGKKTIDLQIRCKNANLCTKTGTRVIVTDLNRNNKTDFVLSSRAFAAMAHQGMSQDILRQGIVDVDYKR